MNEIFTRHSTRYFQAREVEQEKVDILLKAAMQAPSAVNERPWEFIVVTDREILHRLSGFAPGAGPAGRCPVCIVLLADSRRFKVPGMWQQDMGACCQNILLQAESMGLGAVWMGLEPIQTRTDAVRSVFALPEYIKPFAMIAVGYPDEEKETEDRFDRSRIHTNCYRPEV